MSSGLAAPPVKRGSPAGKRSSEPRDKKTFRRDIQGLRALGLIVVFLCHAEFSFGSGGFVGLDIFFVISGFLITGLIVQELERTGTLSLTAFYARRVRRLLPLAMTVLAVVVLGSWVLYSPVQADSVAGDVVAASLYFVNWRFAAQEVDYFAVDPADSPIQHFWSLSVEEQFYLVWPALLLVAFSWAARRGFRRMRPALWGALALVGAPSLLYSVHLIDLATNAAYFSTLARTWEFALGGMLALALPSALRLPRPMVAAMAWGGVGTILATTVVFTAATPYPGSAALLPTLATAGIVVAGTASMTSSAPMRLLSSGPFQYLGNISYAWYLWHWPALVFARALWGPLDSWESLLVIGAAWIPTAVTHHTIEEPFRYSRGLARRPRRAIGFGVASIGGAAVMAVALTALQPTVPTASSHEFRGAAAALADGKALQKRATALRPPPRKAKDDRGRLYEDGCLVPQEETESPSCVYGNPSSETTVVLLGDSHAMHFFPALDYLAQRRDWRLVGLTRAGCTAADVKFAHRCDAWREHALERIDEKERPELVIVATTTSGRLGVVEDGERLSRADSERQLEEGFARTLRRLRSTGAQLVVLADLPRSSEDVPSCVSRALDRLEDCAFPSRRRPGGDFDVRAAARVEGTTVVDPARLLCRTDTCPAVIGNALVYRDDNHLTATFAATLGPWLGRRLPMVR